MSSHVLSFTGFLTPPLAKGEANLSPQPS
jgi:hypothetical protein